MNQTTQFFAEDAEGKRYKWSFWRAGGIWFLRDHNDYVRTLETTWNASVSRIRSILENHGLKADIS